MQVIGHYKILRKIARGSTSNVYEGYDLQTDHSVALKIMSSRLDKEIGEADIKVWLQEAEIVSQLDHPNIIRIYDAAVDNGRAYIAMDYIVGYSMALHLKKCEPITVEECIRISRSVLNALTEAHRHGVVHGDIKPANILFDTDRETYIVTDFGAAYNQKDQYYNGSTIVGTPHYMSPEQLEGKKLDGRSDLFSLSVSLCHLLTGHQPFHGQSLPQLKASIMGDEPDLGQLQLPTAMAKVIAKGLEKKPYMRFVDAEQMLGAIEQCGMQ